jgi:uroporphyrinogen III methyltransferase/synthase
MSSVVSVVTGHIGRTPNEGRPPDWGALARGGGTIVILMGMAERAGISRLLIEGGRPPSEPVAVIERGTTASQRSVRTSLGELAAVDLESPAVIVVGDVAALDLAWYERRPLHGWRVVVTRAAAQSASLRDALLFQGAEVVELPVITIAEPSDGGAALERAVLRSSTYDWVVLTSANAADRFLAHLTDGRALAGVRLAAVGKATADRILEWHLVADLVPAVSTAEGLVDGFAARTPDDATGRVLYPRAAEVRDVLSEGLRLKGWTVDEVEAYRTVPAGPEDATPARLDAAAGADVITFTAPSTVKRYLEVAGRENVPPCVACIGPVTAGAAREAGLAVDVVAEDQSAQGLVEALVAHRRRKGS